MRAGTFDFPLLDENALTQLTAEKFTGDPPASTLQCQPIVKGGSVRTFFRYWLPDGQSIICMHYSSAMPENLLYTGIGKFLTQHGVSVPRILEDDRERQVIWMEDVGTTDLNTLAKERANARHVYYHATLEELVKLQSIDPLRSGSTVYEERVPELTAGFGPESYRWEQLYFFDKCLNRFFDVPMVTVQRLMAMEIWKDIAERLGREAPVLVHRDFQSTNIIIRGSQAYLIDFQGMRLGRPEYDLASLLFDPYVPLTAKERKHLRDDYRCLHQGDALPRDSDIFTLCAMQRLMQALGAFGYLGMVKHQERFLEFIPVALQSLREVIDDIPGTKELADVIDPCLSEVEGRIAAERVA